PDRTPERYRARDALNLRIGMGDVFAHPMQLRRLGSPHAASGPHPPRTHLEIESGPFMLRQAAPRERRGDVRLERRLVVAEPRVAINAIERQPGRGHELRGEAPETACELLDDVHHRCAHELVIAI